MNVMCAETDKRLIGWSVSPLHGSPGVLKPSKGSCGAYLSKRNGELGRNFSGERRKDSKGRLLDLGDGSQGWTNG